MDRERSDWSIGDPVLGMFLTRPTLSYLVLQTRRVRDPARKKSVPIDVECGV